MHEAKLNNTPKVEIWGSGKPRREFLYSEDMADACIFLLENRDFVDLKFHTPVAKAKVGCQDTVTPTSVGNESLEVPVETDVTNNSFVTPTSVGKTTQEIRNTHINIGTGKDISIKELAETIKKIVGYEGELYFDSSKPDGTMVKLTDPSKLHALGWRHTVELEEGIQRVYDWYLENI